MGIIEPEHSELFSLELEKIAESDFVYTLASKNINQLAPNLVDMYVTVQSRMNYTIDLLRTEHLRFICPLIRKTAITNFVYTLASANIDQSAPNLAKICMINRSQLSLIMSPLGLE